MIFLRYENFRTYVRSYPITVALAVVIVLYFIFLLIQGDPNSGAVAVRYGGFITVPQLDPFGLEQPWRYITSLFMHANFNHLLFNLFALVVFTPPLERLLKSWRYGLFFILCGIGGNFISGAISTMKNDPHLAVGASGAIYGIYGAYLFIALYRKQMLDEQSRKTILLIIVIGVLSSIVNIRVDFWGHIGGMLTGFLLYKLFDRMHKVRHSN